MYEVLTPVKVEDDILPEWQGTPIHDLLAYHNLEQPYRIHDRAELMITMCMDHRKVLRIPERFAYVLRTGGGNPNRIQFEISLAVAVMGIRALALIAHDDCAMVGLSEHRDAFVQGLIRESWKHEDAENHFDINAPLFEVADTVDFVRAEAHRLQALYPNITIAPLFYSMEDRLLYQV